MNVSAATKLLSPRAKRYARAVVKNSARGMGYDAGWSGISNAIMSDSTIAGMAAGMGDFGSSIPYAASLGYQVDSSGNVVVPYVPSGSGIVGAANHGNLAQAQQLYAQLSGMLNNDVASGAVTDVAGAQAVFAQAAADVQAATANQVQNQAQWQALVNALVARSQALDNDVGYQASQGNLASTTAGQQADAYQGGIANSAAGATNVVAGLLPGGTSVVDTSRAGAALNQALGPGGTLQNPVTDALASWKSYLVVAGVGGALLLVGLAWVHGRGSRRANPRRAKTVRRGPTRRLVAAGRSR